MDELYKLMSKKLDDMRKEQKTEITLDYADASKLFRLVCYMCQIRFIVDGME